MTDAKDKRWVDVQEAVKTTIKLQVSKKPEEEICSDGRKGGKINEGDRAKRSKEWTGTERILEGNKM